MNFIFLGLLVEVAIVVYHFQKSMTNMTNNFYLDLFFTNCAWYLLSYYSFCSVEFPFGRIKEPVADYSGNLQSGRWYKC